MQKFKLNTKSANQNGKILMNQKKRNFSIIDQKYYIRVKIQCIEWKKGYIWGEDRLEQYLTRYP